MPAKRIYKVCRHGGGRLHYLSPLGKFYTKLDFAIARAQAIVADGGKATIFYADADWKELEVSDGVFPGEAGSGD